MNKSKCPVCGSRYIPSDLDLWKLYQENKQTVAELAASLGTSPSTIKRRLRNVVIKWSQPALSGSGFVHIDATYWGRNCGVIVAQDTNMPFDKSFDMFRSEKFVKTTKLFV